MSVYCIVNEPNIFVNFVFADYEKNNEVARCRLLTRLAVLLNINNGVPR